MRTNGKNVPRDFFLLLMVLTIPFYLFGGRKLPLPVNLPASALMFFSLFTTALVISYRQAGKRGVGELLKKAVDFRKIKPKTWYLPSLLLMPLIYGLSYAIMVWIGAPLPEPEISLLAVLAFSGIFLLEAVLEELGFQGVVFEPMQARWGALQAAILLGFAWQLWHLIPLIQAGNPAQWIFWHILEGVALRVLIVWVYNNTSKSVFTSILMHTSVNVSWTMFPNFGSGYNPFYTAVLTWLAAALVVYGWGGKTLRRFRFAKANQI